VNPTGWSGAASRGRIAFAAIAIAAAVAASLVGFATQRRALASSPNGSGSGSVLLDQGEYRLPDEVLARAPLPAVGDIERESSAVPDAWETVFQEDYESASWPAGGTWSVYDDDAAVNGEYYWSNRCSGRGSARGAWAVGGGSSGVLLPCGATYPNHAQSYMIAGPFDLSDATDAELYFEFWVNSECIGTECSGGGDFLRVWASSDGETWGGIRIAGEWITDPAADPEGWLAYTHEMDSYAGESMVWIAFIFDANSSVAYPGGAKVDNVRLRADKCPSTATIRSSSLDRTCYVPGSTAGILVDVGTSLSSQRVTVTASLWYSADILITDASTTFTAPGVNVIELEIPTEAWPGEPIAPGDYEISLWVRDAESGCFQAEKRHTVRIDPACGTDTPETPETPEVTPTPSVIETLCPGETAHETKSVHISAAPARADVLFAFDTTGSMGPVLSSAKTNALGIMSDLAVLIPDIQFGVVDFRDYPISPLGDPGDWAYMLRQPMTSNRTAVETAINATNHGGGSDGPEAYSRVLYESYSDSSIGWRADSRRFVLVFGDNVPHDNNLNERIVSPPRNPGGTWCNRSDPCYLDPGRDGAIGTGDDLDLQSVLDTMRDRRITLVFVVGGSGSSDWHDTVVAYWKQWASWTNVGGDAVSLSDAADLPAAIRDLISSAGSRIGRLALETNPSSYQSWITSAPPAYTDLTIPPGGRTVTFDIAFRVPAGTPLGTNHTFQVRAVGDGAVYAEQTVSISVPRDCPGASPTATLTPPRPSATPTHTPSATWTPIVCPSARPPVAPECAGPNLVRNPFFELASRSWGLAGNPSGEVLTRGAMEGFYSASFDGSPYGTTDIWLYQYLDMPDQIDSVSFDVERVRRSVVPVSPSSPTGRDVFRASLYDAWLGVELVRLWEVDPLLPERCAIDDPSFNLTPAQRTLLAGRRVVLVFRLHTETRGWSSNITIDGVKVNVCTSGPPCSVEGDKTAQPGAVRPNGEAAVTLSLTGYGGLCLPSRSAADVVLVLDRSGSMEGRPIADLRTAAKDFLDRMDPSRDQVALVSFADVPLLNARLTSWPGSIRTEIDALVASGNTNIGDAIGMAQAELASGRHRPGSQPIIVLMSDGQPNRGGDPVAAAASAKAAGTRIFTIGLGSEVDPDLIRTMASSSADAFMAVTSADLAAIYGRISGLISGAPATDITVVDRLSPYVTLIPGSFFGAPAPQISSDGRTLTWTFPRLGIETLRWGYRVRMTDRAGKWPTNEIATATYTNSRGEPSSLVFPIPEVTVIPVDEGHPELVCRDHSGDTGAVPSNSGGEAWWDSPDIWVRNAPDGVESHQNPVVGAENTLYVRVRNTGNAEARDVTVHAYDAAGAANIRWPDDWVPSIGTATVSRIAPGASAVVAIAWTPNFDGHTCFLARIESATDPIRHEGWVPFDNNICQRNMKVVGTAGSSSTGVRTGNRHIGPDYGTMRVSADKLPDAPSARGRIIFPDGELFDRWRSAGGTVSGAGRVIESERAVEFDLDRGKAAAFDSDRSAPGDGIDIRIERIPFEGEEVGDFKLEVEGLGGAEPPAISIEHISGGTSIGGIVVRPPQLPTLYLPYGTR